MPRLQGPMFLAALLLASAPCSAAVAQATGPCADSTYTALKRKTVDSLSAREYEMFRERDRACLAATARDTTVNRTDPAADFSMGMATGREAAGGRSTAGWFLGGFVGAIGGLIGAGVVFMLATASESQPTADELASLVGKSALFVQGYTEAYSRRLGSKKKNSATVGLVAGLSVVLFVLLGALDG